MLSLTPTPMHELSDDGVTSATSPAKREAIATTLRNLDALVALAATEGGPAARDSAADRRFLERLALLRGRLRESAATWDAESTRELDAANARVEAGTRRIITLTGATAILAILLGLLTWRMVGRSGGGCAPPPSMRPPTGCATWPTPTRSPGSPTSGCCTTGSRRPRRPRTPAARA